MESLLQEIRVSNMTKQPSIIPQRQGKSKENNKSYFQKNYYIKPIEDNTSKEIFKLSNEIAYDSYALNNLFIIALIPAYNEGESIKNIISLTRKYVDHIIVCNDGSSDKTADIVSKMNVDLVNHMKNIGKGQALRTLFKEATKYNPDIIVTLDGDGQHDPLEIPRLLKEIVYNKSDVVIGSRFLQGSVTDITRVRSFGLKTINLLERLLFNFKISDTQSGFRAFSNSAFQIFSNSREIGYGTEMEQNILAHKYGLQISEVPVTITYKNLPNSSKKHFIKHGFELLTVMVRQYIRNTLSSNKVKK